ncbi:MAG: transposase, partial [Streptosporangiaceae bacterium]
MQGTSWARGLELIGDDERLVAHAGVLPARLLAERLGLTRGLSAGMRRRGFEPVYDRGQVLLDLALTLIAGGEAISDFQALAHLAPVIGPVPPAPTVWRALKETGDLQVARMNAVVTEFRRHWWGLLADRPQGFPWLNVAGKELTGITVIDLDASVVFSGSEKENAKATDKGGTGFCPNLAACDNTGDMLAIDPRPGNATANCAADNIALLDLAVSRLPGRFRHNVLVRLDGAGFSHELLEHVAAGGGKRGRHWEFSVGWSCTDVEMDAIARLPGAAWTAGTDQDGNVLEDTLVAELTGLLDLDAWTGKIPGLRILVREEPLHPRYRKRATEREIKLGRRYQLIATNTRQGQLAWLDVRHRSHVHVESNVKQAKALGLNRWPSRHWAVNVAWTQVVALAANLLAAFRHLALP